MRFAAIALLNFFLCNGVLAQDLSRSPEKENHHPKISSVLQKLEKEYKEGTTAARLLAQGMDISSPDPDKLTVYLMLKPNTIVDEDALYDIGAQIIKKRNHVIKAKVPVNMLTAIADTIEGISFIKAPDKLIPMAVESEGVDLTGAENFHIAGYNGSDVKVAVIDVGFDNLDSAILNGELPSDVIKIDCTGASCVPGNFSSATETERHGTAVSEIVYDMAPGVTLYLIKITDIMDLEDAENFAVNNGIKIINHSLVVANTNFYDGICYSNNPVCTANDAYANNILWVNAAGNEAQQHYEAVFSGLGDQWHNVSADSEKISLDNGNTINAGDTIEVYMTWDAWPVTDQDYDLFLYDGSGILVDSSVDFQTGTQQPTEKIVYKVPADGDGSYYLRIRQESADSDHSLEVYSIYHELSPKVESSSLLGPADAAGVLAVGAINSSKWATGPQASYSSQGPTNDGRIKPDIMGPDNVSTDIYSLGFTGTSASCPHVSGAAALILHKFPGLSVDDLWNFLISTAVDMGSPGKDNIYGNGRLRLDINAAITTSTIPTTDGGGGGGCFIATATNGSYASPNIRILREMWDRYLIKSHRGKYLIRLY